MTTAIEVNCTTGEVTERELTAAELAQREVDAAEFAARKAEEDAAAEAAAAAKASGQAKLAALGLTADEIAHTAEFFSFGTNDLTQTTLGVSRDDMGNFLGAYTENEIFKKNPFASLDQTGVGQLVKIAIEKGRQTRPDIKLGICGEHGGEPESVKFCHRVGLSYVSCSPYRIPVARLAAAQAAIEEKRAAKKQSVGLIR